jgi:hypothetical protein
MRFNPTTTTAFITRTFRAFAEEQLQKRLYKMERISARRSDNEIRVRQSTGLVAPANSLPRFSM